MATAAASETIRNATERDLRSIVQIYNSHIPGRLATADIDPVSVESRLDWLRDRDFNVHPIWVLERKQQIVAWLSFKPFYGRLAYQKTAELGVYVHPDACGTGAGSSLLRAAITRAPKLGLKTLLGFVFAHNAPSIGLFRKFGFAAWGLLPRVAELDGIERDLVILGRRVDDA